MREDDRNEGRRRRERDRERETKLDGGGTEEKQREWWIDGSTEVIIHTNKPPALDRKMMTLY